MCQSPTHRLTLATRPLGMTINRTESDSPPALAVNAHADRVGIAGATLRLSLQRSAAVKAALLRNGVPEAAIRSGGLGEEDLPVPTADQVPDRLNRSVHITVSGRPLMSDQDYCAALARKWRTLTRSDASRPAPQAIAQCHA